MSFGFAGKIAHVDLETEKVKEEPLDPQMAREFIGGCGIGYRLGAEYFKKKPEPLSPETPLILNAGPLIGTLAPSANKISMTTKSPVDSDGSGSKHYIASSVGGTTRLGIMVKYAGYDHIVIAGKCRRPSYLLITDEGIKICGAEDLWKKKDVYETTEILARRHAGTSGDAGVLAIGLGGENLVTVSTAIVDGSSTLGKVSGPVMGSKNLKAIVAYGSGNIKIRDPRRFLNSVREVSGKIAKWREHTSPFFYEGPAAVRGMSDEYRESYSEEGYRESFQKFMACTACPSACRASFLIRDGKFLGRGMQTSHWLVLPNYGQRLRVKDYREMMVLVDEINRQGLDLFSTVQLITFVTRLFVHREIGKEETGGLELSRSFDCYLKLIGMIANREGIGRDLGEGWYATAKKLGVDPFEHYDAPGIVKGTDSNVDARSWTVRPASFSQIVNPRGGYFHVATPIWIHHPGTIEFDRAKRGFEDLLGLSAEAKERIFPAGGWKIGRLNRHCEDIHTLFNALGICCLYHTAGSGAMTLHAMSELYSAATGFELDDRQLKTAGERVWNYFKMLNVGEGFSRKDDRWPAIWAKSIGQGAQTSSGTLVLRDYYGKPVQRGELETLLDEYYEERGWDIETGIPAKEKLSELGLEEYFPSPEK